MASETWRVVLASGEVLGVATPQGTRGDATRVAIARNCALWHWPVAEILAPGEPTRAELLAQIATLTRVVDALRAAAVVAGHPAADGDPDAQLCAVRAAAWNAGAEAMRQEIVVSLTPREVDLGRLDRELGVIHALPAPPCPRGVCCGTAGVSR